MKTGFGESNASGANSSAGLQLNHDWISSQSSGAARPGRWIVNLHGEHGQFGKSDFFAILRHDNIVAALVFEHAVDRIQRFASGSSHNDKLGKSGRVFDAKRHDCLFNTRATATAMPNAANKPERKSRSGFAVRARPLQLLWA